MLEGLWSFTDLQQTASVFIRALQGLSASFVKALRTVTSEQCVNVASAAGGKPWFLVVQQIGI